MISKVLKRSLISVLALSMAGAPVFAADSSSEAFQLALANIDRDVVIVRVATGKAERKSEDGKWLPIAIGSTLADNDMVRTAKNSSILIELPENSGYVRILPESELKVEQVKVGVGFEGGQITEFMVNKGKVITKVRKFNRKSSRLRVKTRGATAAVRGTSFLTSYNDISQTKVLVGDGAVSVKAKGKEVMVKPKEFTKIGLGDAPDLPAIVREKLDFSISDLAPNNGMINVTGFTDPEAQVNLNTSSFFPNNDGSFIGNLALKTGVNNVVIKTSTIDGRQKSASFKVLKFTD